MKEILDWLDEKPTLARLAGAARKLDALDPAGLDERRVFVVRNFTIEPIEPALKVAGYRAGLRLHISYSGYEPVAALAEAEGFDVVLLALRLEELAPSLTGPLAADALENVVSLARGLRARSRAPVIVHNFVAPLAPRGGLAATQDPAGPLNLVRWMNVELARRLADVEGAHLLDADHALSAIGLRAAQDERGARVGDAPLSQDALRALADAQVRHIRALRGAAAKLLVVDCDNTLWSGVIGEDGMSGIGFGPRHRALHETLLDLRRRGIVLAISSKNEEADVLEVLREHPDCLVSEDDFAAMRINWEDKASAVAGIAAELNLGLQHTVFLDDNPVECEWVASQLPEVRVVQWPAELDELGLFDSLVVTEEDRARTEMYRAETRRRAAREEIGSVDDYLRSLEMVATVGLAGPERLPRVAQLTQKTNQFNLTTRRHDLAALQEMARDPDTRIVWLDLRDRFGSSGVIGCGIVRRRGEEAHIDTLLMSCRVIGRGVESVLVNRLATFARELGATTLVGEFVPTKRNAQVAELYPRLGFEGPASGPWRWSLNEGVPPAPGWFEIVDVEEAPV